MRPPSSNLQEIRDKLKSYKIDWNHRIFSLEPQAHWKGFVPWKLCLMRPDLCSLGPISSFISAGLRVDQSHAQQQREGTAQCQGIAIGISAQVDLKSHVGFLQSFLMPGSFGQFLVQWDSEASISAELGGNWWESPAWWLLRKDYIRIVWPFQVWL